MNVLKSENERKNTTERLNKKIYINNRIAKLGISLLISISVLFNPPAPMLGGNITVFLSSCYYCYCWSPFVLKERSHDFFIIQITRTAPNRFIFQTASGISLERYALY